MIVAGILLILLLVTGVTLRLLHRDGDNAAASLSTPADTAADSASAAECCGLHLVCERDLLPAITDEPEYYDDEELDAYCGRSADSYTDHEVEQFRDVLLTLIPSDIAGWARSIDLRGIALPTCLRDEMLMIVTDARANA